jgi:predicted deacylase
MSWNIEHEIDRFTSFPKTAAPHLAVEPLCEFGFVVKPRSGPVMPVKKAFALTILGLTHGNEYAGVAVVNSILSFLNAGAVKLDFPVAFALGNPWAARENKRFLERDLNRSFSRTDALLLEEKRADVLEKVLKETAFLVDYHQVSRPSDRPFFIFPYTRDSYAFARAIVPAMTMVTHWGDSFSSDGMCTDEFVNEHGGTGISIELGQNGFDVYQVAAGIEAGLRSIAVAAGKLKGQSPDAFTAGMAATNVGELYSWSEVIRWPDQGIVDLRDGWNNFGEVAAGESIGTVDGRPIYVKEGGRILFPKYLTRDQQAQLTTRPTELCRIMKKIDVSVLP